MKFSNLFVALMMVVVVVMAIFMDSTEARNKKKQAGGKKVCKFDRKGEEGPCDAATNTKEITLMLKKGDQSTCQPTKVVSKQCNDNSLTKRKKVKGCKYEKKGSDWTECDATSNARTKVMKLKAGSPAECPATRIKTKSCGNHKNKNNNNGGRRPRKDA